MSLQRICRPIRSLVRSATVLALMMAATIFAIGTADAGGPTSALLVSPSTDSAAAVYYSDPEYDTLMTLLGGVDLAGDPTKETIAPDGDYVTVTWMIHDVSVWRIDRIFLGGGGQAARIVTQMSDGSSLSGAGMYPGEAGNAKAVTHRSPDPVALHAVLTSLKVLPAEPPGAWQVGPSTAAAQPAADDSAGLPVTTPASMPAAGISSVASDTTGPAGSPFWWALAGLAAGGALMAAALRWVPALRKRRVDPSGSDEPISMVPIS